MGNIVQEKSFAFALRIVKLRIALKESAETSYWLQLLHESSYLNDAEFQSISSNCKELEKLLSAIVKTAKNNS